MSKKMIWSLILIAVVVVVAIMNRGNMDLNVVVTDVKAMKSLVLLGFTAMGIVIGLFLK